MSPFPAVVSVWLGRPDKNGYAPNRDPVIDETGKFRYELDWRTRSFPSGPKAKGNKAASDAV
jgi:hypothetical protein